MINKLYLYVAGLILCGGLLGVAYLKGRSNGYEAGIEESRKAAHEAAERFAEAIQEQQRLLLKTDGELVVTRRVTKQIQETLDDALRTPEGMAWGDVPLPDSVGLSVNAARDTSVPGDTEKPD
jgi:hypothetical protein